MKVRCIKLLDELTGSYLEHSPWLSIGKTYTVLSINLRHGSLGKFQLISDDHDTPTYHNSNQFEIVSQNIPKSWIIDFEADSHFSLAPKAWSEPGFLEAYFDGEPEAIKLFNTEKDIIFNED
ncbi:MAG: hypothetical protein V4629_02580 [Pseudomonadota bacterium]